MKQIAQLGNIEEDSLIDYIIAGIRDLELNKMILYGATSIDELKLKLELYEKMKLNVRQIQSQSANINRCYNCGTKGHRSSSCPDASKGFKCFLCQEFGHKASSCSYRPSTSRPNNDRIDTNSDVNLCRRSFILKLDKITICKDKTLLGGPGGVKFYIEGVFTYKLSVDGSSYTIDIYVVPDVAITCDLLVGKAIFQTSAELHINPKCVRITKFEEEENQKMSINKPYNELNIGASTYTEEINNIVKDYEPNKVKHAPIETVILLMDEKPVYQGPWCLSPAETCEVDKQIEEWLQEDIIRPSCSDYASPIVLVRKKDNSLRFCVDYRMLNRKIIKDRYPLPLIDDQIDKLQGASVYTTLDLRNGFSMFQFIKISLSIPLLSHLVGNMNFCEPLLDLILASSYEESIELLKQILQTASEYGLHIKWSKCQFLHTEIEYLGYRILQNFLGLTGYFRKFIKNYSLIAKPLTDLLHNGAKFKFGKEEQDAINMLKRKLVDNPVLHIYEV
ncbi:uncharacterized protein LOC126908211 [Daktulosphaira vitifoliae]|uniref:uncharacterized protein LOC126908211 n=1 Tax=Daktulosphaira vitifoliae TaxID=58002 RepID=UPI0021A9D82E|nr:uncharacterized protein LOC126908211 [Daktulosphaira vitifoliae]